MPLCKEQTASRLNISYKMSSTLESGNIFMLMIKNIPWIYFLIYLKKNLFAPIFLCILSYFIHKEDPCNESNVL